MNKIELIRGNNCPDLPRVGLLWTGLRSFHLAWLSKVFPEDFYQECILFLLPWDLEQEPFPEVEFLRSTQRHFYSFAVRYGWCRKGGFWHRRERLCGALNLEQNQLRNSQARRLKVGSAWFAQEWFEESLIQQLALLARQLGKTPSREDIAKASQTGKCASPGTYQRFFGSLKAAQEAAGLDSNSSAPSPWAVHKIPDKILTMLRNSEPLMPGEIKVRLQSQGIPEDYFSNKNTLYGQIKRLKIKGDLVKRGDGRYELSRVA